MFDGPWCVKLEHATRGGKVVVIDRVRVSLQIHVSDLNSTACFSHGDDGLSGRLDFNAAGVGDGEQRIAVRQFNVNLRVRVLRMRFQNCGNRAAFKTCFPELCSERNFRVEREFSGAAEFWILSLISFSEVESSN